MMGSFFFLIGKVFVLIGCFNKRTPFRDASDGGKNNRKNHDHDNDSPQPRRTCQRPSESTGRRRGRRTGSCPGSRRSVRVSGVEGNGGRPYVRERCWQFYEVGREAVGKKKRTMSGFPKKTLLEKCNSTHAFNSADYTRACTKNSMDAKEHRNQHTHKPSEHRSHADKLCHHYTPK